MFQHYLSCRLKPLLVHFSRPGLVGQRLVLLPGRARGHCPSLLLPVLSLLVIGIISIIDVIICSSMIFIMHQAVSALSRSLVWYAAGDTARRRSRFTWYPMEEEPVAQEPEPRDFGVKAAIREIQQLLWEAGGTTHQLWVLRETRTRPETPDQTGERFTFDANTEPAHPHAPKHTHTHTHTSPHTPPHPAIYHMHPHTHTHTHTHTVQSTRTFTRVPRVPQLGKTTDIQQANQYISL